MALVSASYIQNLKYLCQHLLLWTWNIVSISCLCIYTFCQFRAVDLAINYSGGKEESQLCSKLLNGNELARRERRLYINNGKGNMDFEHAYQNPKTSGWIWHANVDVQLRWRTKLNRRARVRGLNWSSQEFRDELDPRAKVEGRHCLFCLLRTNYSITY